jgi:hypothetical protein
MPLKSGCFFCASTGKAVSVNNNACIIFMCFLRQSQSYFDKAKFNAQM